VTIIANQTFGKGGQNLSIILLKYGRAYICSGFYRAYKINHIAIRIKEYREGRLKVLRVMLARNVLKVDPLRFSNFSITLIQEAIIKKFI